MGFSNRAQRFTGSNYLDVDSPLKKRNLPKNNKILNELKVFLGAVESKLLDPKNRKKSQCIISTQFLEAFL